MIALYHQPGHRRSQDRRPEAPRLLGRPSGGCKVIDLTAAIQIGDTTADDLLLSVTTAAAKADKG